MATPIEEKSQVAPPTACVSKSSTGLSDLNSKQRDASNPVALYRNSLLAAVGYLDLANAMDFPANVWNNNPIPLFAKVLMGLGGSIAILSTGIAFWDMHRSRKNIKVLREEREYLKERIRQNGPQQELPRGQSQQQESQAQTQEEDIKAWLAMNSRELGWEIIDRMLLDVFMAAAGILVGTGCLLAIRGDIPIVFSTSNELSGYVGNSFVAAYAVLSTGWSVYMWTMAHKNRSAVIKASSEIDRDVLLLLQKHAARHKIYAIVNGLALLVSGVGSEVSSTLWPGYVVLIPAIIGSVFCNYYWRHCLGYNRRIFQDRSNPGFVDLARLRLLRATRRHFIGDQAEDADSTISLLALNSETILRDCLHDVGLAPAFQAEIERKDLASETFPEAHSGNVQRAQKICEAYLQCISTLDERRFRDEERFWLELYGYHVRRSQDQTSAGPQMEQKA